MPFPFFHEIAAVAAVEGLPVAPDGHTYDPHEALRSGDYPNQQPGGGDGLQSTVRGRGPDAW